MGVSSTCASGNGFFRGRPGPRLGFSSVVAAVSATFRGRPGPRFGFSSTSTVAFFRGRPGPRFGVSVPSGRGFFLGRPGPRFGLGCWATTPKVFNPSMAVFASSLVRKDRTALWIFKASKTMMICLELTPNISANTCRRVFSSSAAISTGFNPLMWHISFPRSPRYLLLTAARAHPFSLII